MMLLRLLLLVAALFASAAPARADDVSAAGRSVVRVVVVQFEDGEIVDFGHGSGFAVGPNRIVTNAHVVALGASDPDNVAIGVVPSEGSESFGARIVAIDAGRDLALLEMQEGSVTPVTLFTGALDAGAAVAALGYPGNVDLATARSMQDYVRPLPPTRSMGNYSDMRRGDAGATLVHTADIARGHSGGPLVDGCGRVIGVNRMITRNDMGDSTFGFAIPVAALTDFLRQARQPFRAVASACVSQEARERAEAERAERERRARDADEATRLRTADERRDRSLLALQESRENRLGIAVLLLVLSLAALAATFVLALKDRHRPAWAAGAAAALLLLGAGVVFFTRPSLTALEDDGSGSEARPTASFAGANRCRLDRERSRVTISTAEEVDLSWQEGGCVNGNTQYAQDNGRWRRVLVPNGEQTVTVSEFDAGSGDYVVSRYLLSAAAMAKARRLRQRVEQKSCTGDAEALAILADRQRDLAAALPRTPNEQLVYRCAGAQPS
jgi:S1-C subfamily serine protease